MALEHPSWGCGRIAAAIRERGWAISSPTAQKTLIKHGLGRRSDRLKHLEASLNTGNRRKLSTEQITDLNGFNPRIRAIEHLNGGFFSTLVQDALPLSGPQDERFLHVIVDLFSSFAWARLSTGDRAREAATLLDETVRTHHHLGITPLTLLTKKSGPFTSLHYRRRVGRYGFVWQRVKGRRHHGFIEAFLNAFRDEYAKLGPNPCDESIMKLVTIYNEDCLIEGFPNFGATPKAAVDLQLAARMKLYRQHL